MRAALPACLVLSLLVGCGGSSGSSDDEQVRDAVNQFTVKVADGDGSACDLMSADFQASLKSGGRTCEQSMKQFSSYLKQFTSLTISKVVVSGNKATVAFDGSPEVVRLVKEDGEWRVDSA